MEPENDWMGLYHGVATLERVDLTAIEISFLIGKQSLFDKLRWTFSAGRSKGHKVNQTCTLFEAKPLRCSYLYKGNNGGGFAEKIR